MLRNLFIKMSLIFVLIGNVSMVSAQDTPEAFMTAISEDVLKIVSAKKNTYADNPEILEGELLALLDPVVDFKSFSRGVMGKYYEQSTEQQQLDFMVEFKGTLANLYTRALIASDVVDITIRDSALKSPGRATVTMDVVSNGDGSYTVQYSLRRNDQDEWKVRNVILDGVNIGLTYRNQFASAMASEGQNIDAVIQKWPTLIKNGN